MNVLGRIVPKINGTHISGESWRLVDASNIERKKDLKPTYQCCDALALTKGRLVAFWRVITTCMIAPKRATQMPNKSFCLGRSAEGFKLDLKKQASLPEIQHRWKTISLYLNAKHVERLTAVSTTKIDILFSKVNRFASSLMQI